MGHSNFQTASSFLERYANGEFLDWSPNVPAPSFAAHPSFTYLKPPEPHNERERLQVVFSIDPHISPTFQSFAEKTRAKLGIIVDLAKSIFQVDTVVINLIDDKSLRIKASRDFPVDAPSRDESLCAHALLRNGTEPIVVPDTKKDWRFANHPLVTQAGYRFWSGAPLRTEDGHNIGVLSLFSRTPRTEFGPVETQKQVYMASICIQEFENYREGRMLAQIGRWQNTISRFSQRFTLCKSSQEIFQLATDDIARGLEMEIVFIVEIHAAERRRPTFHLHSSVGLNVPPFTKDKMECESKGREAGAPNEKDRLPMRRLTRGGWQDRWLKVERTEGQKVPIETHEVQTLSMSRKPKCGF